MEKLDVTSFKNALNSLKSIIKRYENEQDADIRDAVIQRFEYTYSFCLKMIVRYFNTQTADASSIQSMTFNQIIRQANQMNLLRSNLEKWDEYRKKRNMTSHTYDENVALEVVKIIPDFALEAEFLLNELERRAGT